MSLSLSFVEAGLILWACLPGADVEVRAGGWSVLAVLPYSRLYYCITVYLVLPAAKPFILPIVSAAAWSADQGPELHSCPCHWFTHSMDCAEFFFSSIAARVTCSTDSLTQCIAMDRAENIFSCQIIFRVSPRINNARVTFKEAEKSYQSDRLSLEKFFPHFFVYLRRF